MERQRQFIHDLYKNRIGFIPFLEYFKNDKLLRNKLFKQYLDVELKINSDLFYDQKCRPEKLKENYDKEVFHWREILHNHILNNDLPKAFNTPDIEHTPIFIGLKNSFKLIDDFKSRVLLPKDYDPVKYAETFTFNLTSILKSLEVKELTEKVLNDFLNDNENQTISGYLIFSNKKDFEKKYNKSYEIAWQYYRELKGYADKYIKEFLLEIKNDCKISEQDFSKWIIPKSHPWKEIGYQFTTGKNYRHPQDLKAVFNNSYAYYPAKVKGYFEKFGILPLEYLNNLIFEFRQEFPVTGRVQNINYFDDLLNNLIKFYQKNDAEIIRESSTIEDPNNYTQKIDWVKVFEQIDISKEIKRQIHKTTTYEQKENYFSKASFNLTLQYLHSFKKETDFFSNKRKLAYINAINIEPPKSVHTESTTFNQTVFEGQSNYYEFIQNYKTLLEKTELFDQNGESQQRKKKLDKIELLETIWSVNAKLSIVDFIELGIEKGIWNKSFDLITKRNSMYGKGKTLLGSLSIALKDYTINKNIDHKRIGRVFCDVFNIPENKQTNDPYKSFSNGNPKYIKEFKRSFKIS